MQRKQHALAPLIKVGLCAIFAVCATDQIKAQDKKVDPAGTWTWTTPARDGGEARKSTLKLKVEAEKLTGTISAPGRQGQTSDTAISEGKLKGEEVSFTVTREFNGNKLIMKYSGKLSGDSIKGKIETERNGQTRSRDWEAKRETAKKS